MHPTGPGPVCQTPLMRFPSPRAYFTNWKDSELPLSEKVSRTLRNNWKKLRTGSACCGNHGDPGC